MLLYSTERKVYWEVGTFDKRDLLFHSETRGLLDHGSYYAMKSMVDARGRRILWGWVQETRTPAECEAAGWAGAMALPRILSLGADNQLRMEVPPEFASLRGETGGTQIKNRAGDIVCRFKVGDTACGLDLRAGAGFVVRHALPARQQADAQPRPNHRAPLARTRRSLGGSSMDGWFSHRGVCRQ